MEDKKIEERLKELQDSLEEHSKRLNQARQIVEQETQQIIAKSGAIANLQDLLKPEPSEVEPNE